MHPFLQLPTRVSRLYPIFTIILLASTASFLYAWQATKIELDRLPQVEERNKSLEGQVTQLLDEQKKDHATLSLQQKQIQDSTNKLADLNKQLQVTSQDLANKNQQIQNQQDQLNQNAADLAKLRAQPPLFSFQNNSDLPDISQKEADVKQLVTDAYSYIQNLYGQPYLLNSITITFVPQGSFAIKGAASEIVIENSAQGIKINIHLEDFNKNDFQSDNAVIHEMIHGFHGVAVFDLSAQEEGITVAATDAVMTNMIADGKIPPFSHLYITVSPDQYAAWNNSLQVPADNQAFYNNLNIAKLYQLVGRAWYNLYQADHDIFKKINAHYYPLVQQGKTPDAQVVLDAIRASITSVNGQSIDAYLSSNHAFYPQ